MALDKPQDEQGIGQDATRGRAFPGNICRSLKPTPDWVIISLDARRIKAERDFVDVRRTYQSIEMAATALPV